jgi:hypothetical protein
VYRHTTTPTSLGMMLAASAALDAHKHSGDVDGCFSGVRSILEGWWWWGWVMDWVGFVSHKGRSSCWW